MIANVASLLGFTRQRAAQPGSKRAPQVTAKASSPGQTVADRRRMALRPPSFTDMLPYISYAPDERIFVLRDGNTLGAMFELSPIATEAMPIEILNEHAQKIQEALQAMPSVNGAPWIAQFFVNDDRNLDHLNDTFTDYILEQHKDDGLGQEILNSPFTQAVLDEVRSHLSNVSQPNGLFTDTLVTGQVWRGQIRRVRCCLYRRFGGAADDPQTPVQQIESVANTIMATFSEAGVAVRRCTGKDLYEWLLPFFNRDLPWAPGTQMMRELPYPGDTPLTDDEDTPIFGWDLSELLSINEPRSNLEQGLFEFDGVPVKALTLQNMRKQPEIGHFTAELANGKERFARFDRLPPGSMLSVSITIAPQHVVESQIERIRDASRAKTAQAIETYRECTNVLNEIVRGNHLFPMMVTLYATATSTDELDSNINTINALLIPSGLKFISNQHDLVPLDTFMRALPFNYDPAFDNQVLRRSRLTFASHIARLLPLYGRARGTPHPGMWFWNRGGEPLFVDPLNKRDRKKNAHMLVLGPTGAGKSATLNYIAMMTMAIHRPRLVIVDAGNSFGLLVDFFKDRGLSTYKVELNSSAKVSLPPFVHAYQLLDDSEVMESFVAAEQQARSNAGLPDDELLNALLGQDDEPSTADVSFHETFQAREEDEEQDDELDKRDLLGEMLIAAILMITGGEADEVAQMSRADRYLVSRAIIMAAISCKERGAKHPLTQDVALQLMHMNKDQTMSPARRARAEEMGQSMMTFTQALRGKLFNREGQDWPDADVTLVEMGTLTQDGYEDALAVAYTSLIDSVQSRAELNQHSGRPMVFLTDEGHLITTNELLGPKIAKGTKMWRKFNTWFWLATQNLKDFPDSMERVLSMCEYWMLLTMDKAEIEEVVRFRSLTNEQRAMMESAQKEPPKYTEGVLISATGQMLFRNVPPALPIALAMTEGHEKAHRRRLMEKHGINEMGAAQMVAQELARSRA
ncbi:conjugative transfer ATPase [Alcaligenes faecalis]|uniref:conjugative transfer ATPase n=1 Tax=Alcaligenes faecalis TaxID=511 RepID=UPI0019336791|nr:conjugative transfer ATPase [Alcaligenes faecalis]QRF90611.1 conjugative transfer ATPase [Alcaligenes faecalis]